MPLSANGYEAILFDLDGTIRHLPDSPAALFFKYCAELGLKFGDGALHRLVRWQHAYWADNDQINADRARGEEEFWVELACKELCFLGVTSDVEAHARSRTASMSITKTHGGLRTRTHYPPCERCARPGLPSDWSPTARIRSTNR